MKMLMRLIILLALALHSDRAFSQGVILWDESVNGELSQDFTHPTSLTPLLAGTNSVIGATEVVPYGNNWGGYPDYFVIHVPTNLLVTAAYLTIDKPNVSSWIGDPGYSVQLGGIQDATNGDLVTQWGVSSIGPGAYGMYLDNHDHQAVPSVADYRLDLVAQLAPEPGSSSLLLVGAALLVVGRLSPRTRHEKRCSV